MTYSEIISNRTATAYARDGIAFRHYNAPSHFYKPQFPIATDVLELFDGKLEQKYLLKLVGRHEGGHLFRAGFEQRVFDFTGFVMLDDDCDPTVAQADAYKEIKCFYEFLRGNTEWIDSEIDGTDVPDPRIQIGQFVPRNPGASIDKPFDGSMSKPFDGSVDKPLSGGTASDGTWLDGIFLLVENSFKINKRFFGADIIDFSFQMKQLPINTVMT